MSCVVNAFKLDFQTLPHAGHGPTWGTGEHPEGRSGTNGEKNRTDKGEGGAVGSSGTMRLRLCPKGEPPTVRQMQRPHFRTIPRAVLLSVGAMDRPRGQRTPRSTFVATGIGLTRGLTRGGSGRGGGGRRQGRSLPRLSSDGDLRTGKAPSVWRTGDRPVWLSLPRLPATHSPSGSLHLSAY